MERVMRRKSNFAPSDSEEREDERCTGLHSNDMVEMGVCFRMQGCGKCICVYVCMGIHSHVYYPTRPSRERQSCHFSGKCFLLDWLIPLYAHIKHESLQWVFSAKLLDGHVGSC